jgi:ABC-type glycerol-3-phosphate transport system substrate-binding protein
MTSNARLRIPTLVLVALLGLVLSACSNSSPTSNSTGAGTYRVESYFPSAPYNNWLRSQISIFEQTHKGVKFTVQYTSPSTWSQVLKTSVASGSPPDVATMSPGAFEQQLYAAGDLLNLAPYIHVDKQWESWIAAWNKIPAEQYMSGNSIMATNVSMGAMVVWYWKPMLAKVGWSTFPRSIEGPTGLLALTKALERAGLPTMAIGLNAQALAAGVYDDTFWTLEANFDPGGVKGRLAIAGKYPWTAPPFVDAAALFKTLFDDGVFYEGALEKNYNPDSEVDFGAMRASSGFPFGSWDDGIYPNGVAKNIGVAEFPTLTSTLPLTSTTTNDLTFAVPDVTAQEKEPSRQKVLLSFLKQMNSPESQSVLWKQGIMPVLGSVSSQATSNPWSPVLKAQIALFASATKSIDENTYSPNTDTALDNGLEALLSGHGTPAQLMQKVQAANKTDYSCAPHC